MLDALCEHFAWIVHLEWFLEFRPITQIILLMQALLELKQNYLQSSSLFVADVLGGTAEF
jgi:hypothetical protein